MKTPALFIFLTLFFSCKKNNDSTPTPIVPADTLTTGWKKVKIADGDDLSDIYFANNLVGYACGNKLHKTIDGGNNWTDVSATPGLNITGTPDGKVFELDSDHSIVYTSTNNGGNFTAINLPAGAISYDIFFSDNNNGFVLRANSLLQTTDGGTSWTTVSPTKGLNFINFYNSLFFTNPSTGWILSYKDIYHTNGSINSWAAATFNGTQPIFPFSGIYATTANIVYAVNTAQIFKSTDGGISFSLVKALTEGTFADVHFIDSNNGYVCSGKKVYKTSDGGMNWQPVATIADGNLFEVYFVDANHGWACGSGGTVLIYNQ